MTKSSLAVRCCDCGSVGVAMLCPLPPVAAVTEAAGGGSTLRNSFAAAAETAVLAAASGVQVCGAVARATSQLTCARLCGCAPLMLAAADTTRSCPLGGCSSQTSMSPVDDGAPSCCGGSPARALGLMIATPDSSTRLLAGRLASAVRTAAAAAASSKNAVPGTKTRPWTLWSRRNARRRPPVRSAANRTMPSEARSAGSGAVSSADGGSAGQKRCRCHGRVLHGSAGSAKAGLPLSNMWALTPLSPKELVPAR